MDRNPHIARAIEIVGSQPKLADALGCRQQTISKMLNLEIPVSAEHAMLIEHATKGEVPARLTRPDLPWPDAPRETPSIVPEQFVEAERVG